MKNKHQKIEPNPIDIYFDKLEMSWVEKKTVVKFKWVLIVKAYYSFNKSYGVNSDINNGFKFTVDIFYTLID